MNMKKNNLKQLWQHDEYLKQDTPHVILIYTNTHFHTTIPFLPLWALTSFFKLGLGRPTIDGSGTMKKNTITPTPAMTRPGTMKERPQLTLTNAAAISVPKMLPREVWEFQMPMINPTKTYSYIEKAFHTYLHMCVYGVSTLPSPSASCLFIG